ncbi:unnamed protein product [Phytomonas sp. EM1]|nr:unnamed protein product [Phytomonas sp. EM1]|eukprot:CCW63714.1 unnamed protein product [Phytomonas sp. isolate EM1]
MHQFQYNIPVSFSFIASPNSNYCTEDGTEFHNSAKCSSSQLFVTTHFVDAREGSKMQMFAYNRQQTMRSLYYAICKSVAQSGCIVCYTLMRKKGSCFTSFVEKILLPDDCIPEVVFYQYLLPLPSKCIQLNWVFVNFVVFLPTMKLLPGHLPFIACFTKPPTKKELLEHVVSHFTTTLSEANFLRGCPMTAATVTPESVTIEDDYTTRSNGKHAAILMPLIEQGDVVRVSIYDGSAQSSRTMQGVIQSCRIANGMISYDVQNPDTYEVLCGLNCLQVIPL